MTVLPASPRIACLVPSVTELIAALGLAPFLVARTGYCIHPADLLAGVAKVGGTKDVNLAKLKRLAPSHVIVNIDENRAETVAALRDFVPEIVITHPCGPEDVAALIAQIAATFATVPGVAERAARYPVLTGREAWLAEVQEVLLSSEPYAFAQEHIREAQALCPKARVRLVNGELLSWYGPRTAAGLCYLRQLVG